MAALNKKIKITLGFIVTGVLLAGTAVGILTREINQKINSKQTLSQEKEDYSFANQEIQKPALVCDQLVKQRLEEDQNTLIAREYASAKSVECVYGGCGGIF